MSAELDAFHRLEQLSHTFPGEPWGLTKHELEVGFRPSRSKNGTYSRRLKQGLAAHPPEPEDRKRHARPAELFHPRPGSTARWGKRRFNHTTAMQWFDRCVDVQAKRERNSLRRRARLLVIAKALGLSACMNRQEISQRVLEAKVAATGERFQPLTAADRAAMPQPVVRWLLPGLLPAGDMTIIGGRPKVGKTRLAIAMVQAVLNGTGLLNQSPPSKPAPVVLVTDDQGDGDTAEMLQSLDLWHHPQLIWSRCFRLTETDLDRLLDTVKANPGALVVLDSLRSISRALSHGENDPEIGATLYDLKAAVLAAGGTLLLVHHCNKAAELVGTEALSGHNAIAGAANTVLTLHYMPGENGQPNKAAPERRLVREARSGAPLDVVIGHNNGGGFRHVATLEEWQQQVKQAKDLSNLSTVQEDTLEALTEEWQTRRQVCEAIGVEWGDRGMNGEAKKVGRALNRLVEIHQAEADRKGQASTYRLATCSKSMSSVSSVSSASDANGSGRGHFDEASVLSVLSEDAAAPVDDSEDSRPHAGVLSENPSSAVLMTVRTLRTPPQADRADLLARAAAVGETRDLSGWCDADLLDLIESLEQAQRRRSAVLGDLQPKAVA